MWWRRTAQLIHSQSQHYMKANGHTQAVRLWHSYPMGNSPPVNHWVGAWRWEHPTQTSAKVGTKQSCTSTSLFRAFMTFYKEKQKTAVYGGVVGFRKARALQRREKSLASSRNRNSMSQSSRTLHSHYTYTTIWASQDTICILKIIER